MITKELKTLAEYYALGAISIEQLLPKCTLDNVFETLFYADDFSSKYDDYLRHQEELEAKDIIDSNFADDIDTRCMYNIWQYGFIGEWKMTLDNSPFNFCLEWDIVPEDILNRYIDDCCFVEE